MSSVPKPALSCLPHYSERKRPGADGIFQLSLTALFDVLRKGTEKVSEPLSLEKDCQCIRTGALLLERSARPSCTPPTVES